MHKQNMASSGMRVVIAILLVAVTFIAVPVIAADSSVTAAAEVAVTTIQIDPQVFMQDDTGTIKVEITNSGTQSVAISRAEILTPDLKVVNYQTYDRVGSIGPGNSMEFTFMIETDVREGMYFPMFYLDFVDAGSLRYPLPVKVDDTPISVMVTDAPDSFSAGTKEKITLSVSNPRENPLYSVSVVPKGQGIRTTQSGIFLGTLEPDQEKTVTFEVVADQPTELVFEVSYRNGMNQHQTSVTLPVAIGDRRVNAELVVNNVEVVQGASSITVSGDVTNAGLKDAKSVIVTVEDPAKPADPNPVYVIGALEPDDFSSFEVTCTAQGATSIPLVIEYRDEDGKIFQEKVDISLRSTMSSSGSTSAGQQALPGASNRRPGGFGFFGGGVSQIPVVEIVLVIAGCIAVIVVWRKGYIGRIRERFRK